MVFLTTTLLVSLFFTSPLNSDTVSTGTSNRGKVSSPRVLFLFLPIPIDVYENYLAFVDRIRHTVYDASVDSVPEKR